MAKTVPIIIAAWVWAFSGVAGGTAHEADEGFGESQVQGLRFGEEAAEFFLDFAGGGLFVDVYNRAQAALPTRQPLKLARKGGIGRGHISINCLLHIFRISRIIHLPIKRLFRQRFQNLPCARQIGSWNLRL